MEVFDCIESRHSVRRYEKKDIPNEFVGRIIYAGIQAPSAGNMQPWEFIVVKDEKIKEELATASLRQNHVKNASVVIVICADPEKSGDRYGERGKTLYCIQDTAAAIENMLLAANNLGLGACWVGAFDEEEVKNILNIPEKLRPIAVITLGFPISYEKPIKSSRIPFERITWADKYGKHFSWFEQYGEEWKLKIRPLEEHVKKIKEKINHKKI